MELYKMLLRMPAAVVILLLLAIFTKSAAAKQQILINRGRIDPVPVAFNHSSFESRKEKKIAQELIDVIEADLSSCGLFRSVSSGSFIEDKTGIQHIPLFESWKQIGARFLLNSAVKKMGFGKYEVEFILWDAARAKNVKAKKLTFDKENARSTAHKISNIIYKSLTGADGYFNSKITYCSESGGLKNRKKQIAIMDYDGQNHQYLTSEKNLSILPKFSPDGKSIIYITYKDKTPNIYLLNTVTKKRRNIANFKGEICSANFAPSGDAILIAISYKGNTNLHEFDLKKHSSRQLTSGRGINVSGSYSPDGSKIVFNSNRSGSRQLYVMNRNGSDIQRISYGGGSYASPCWSPDGKYIAFTNMTKNYGFTIGIMRADPQLSMILRDERIIASGYLVEDPHFSPDGRDILFTHSTLLKDGNLQTKLHAISFTGRNERVIDTPLDGSFGNWSRNFD